MSDKLYENLVIGLPVSIFASYLVYRYAPKLDGWFVKRQGKRKEVDEYWLGLGQKTHESPFGEVILTLLVTNLRLRCYGNFAAFIFFSALTYAYASFAVADLRASKESLVRWLILPFIAFSVVFGLIALRYLKKFTKLSIEVYRFDLVLDKVDEIRDSQKKTTISVAAATESQQPIQQAMGEAGQ